MTPGEEEANARGLQQGAEHVLVYAVIAMEKAFSGRPSAARAWWCSFLSNFEGRWILGNLAFRHKDLVKGLVPFEPHDDIKPPPQKPTLEQYRMTVRAMTEKQPLEKLPGIHLRGQGWELDHVVPITRGFRSGTPPETIADISNLWMVPMRYNRAKLASEPGEFINRQQRP